MTNCILRRNTSLKLWVYFLFVLLYGIVIHSTFVLFVNITYDDKNVQIVYRLVNYGVVKLVM
jgi:hypothetical protein